MKLFFLGDMMQGELHKTFNIYKELNKVATYKVNLFSRTLPVLENVMGKEFQMKMARNLTNS
jgi:hypothetical protein